MNPVEVLKHIDIARDNPERFTFESHGIPESNFHMKMHENGQIGIHMGLWVVMLDDERELEMIEWLVNAAIKRKFCK